MGLLNGLADGDVLMYNNSTSTWSPSSLPQDNSSNIASLQTYVTDLSGRTKTVQPHITSVSMIQILICFNCRLHVIYLQQHLVQKISPLKTIKELCI